MTDRFWAVFNASRGYPGGRGDEKNFAEFCFSGEGSHVSDFHESVPLAKACEAFALTHLPVTLNMLQESVLATSM